MIKKAPGGRRKFRAEYLTLSESELCLGSENAVGGGGDGGERRGSRGGETDERGNREEIGSARERQKKRSPVAMLYTGIQRGIVSRVYANLKDPPLRLTSREGGKVRSLKISTDVSLSSLLLPNLPRLRTS